jgi:hypothetical protein
MKHALSAPVLALALLAGCATQPEATQAHEMHVATATRPEQAPAQQAAHAKGQPVATGSLAAGDPKAKPVLSPRERFLRSERQAYARGLEKIMVSNGVTANVLVYEGEVEPTPMLMFFGHFSKEFVHRALTEGAVLARARELGFRSVDFYDRGPDGHFQFVVSKSEPLPRCAADNRMCL